MRITFFKTLRPKEFNYIPRYYDSQKEEAEERRKKIERELGISQEGGFSPSISRGSMQRRMTIKRQANRSSAIRLLVIIAILVLLAYYLLNNTFSFNFLGN
jgi:hypothetical protein